MIVALGISVRRASATDANQPEIVKALRAIGCSVQTLHEVGKGVPDILAGLRGKNYLIEIKDGSKPPSGRQLTSDQKDWHAGWRGTVHVVKNVDEAIRVVVGLL